jgi:hypothetical protein
VSKPGFVTLQKTILISNSTVSQTLTLVRAQNAFPWALLAYVGTGVALAAILVTGAFLWRRSKQGRIATASPQIQG